MYKKVKTENRDRQLRIGRIRDHCGATVEYWNTNTDRIINCSLYGCRLRRGGSAYGTTERLWEDTSGENSKTDLL